MHDQQKPGGVLSWGRSFDAGSNIALGCYIQAAVAQIQAGSFLVGDSLETLSIFALEPGGRCLQCKY